jgi:hypothetical protein
LLGSFDSTGALVDYESLLVNANQEGGPAQAVGAGGSWCIEWYMWSGREMQPSMNSSIGSTLRLCVFA